MKFRTWCVRGLGAIVFCAFIFSLVIPVSIVQAGNDDPTKGSLNLVPCGQVWKDGKWIEKECTFADLNILFQNVITAFFFVLVITLGFLIIRLGFIFLNSGGNVVKRQQATRGLKHLGVGILIMCAAWAFYEFAIKNVIDPDVIQNPLVQPENDPG